MLQFMTYKYFIEPCDKVQAQKRTWLGPEINAVSNLTLW
jgi:hypothetical protein